MEEFLAMDAGTGAAPFGIVVQFPQQFEPIFLAGGGGFAVLQVPVNEAVAQVRPHDLR